MSADLFAQFGPPAGSRSSRPPGQTSTASSAHRQTNNDDDPFAFLSAALASPAPASQPQLQPQTWTAAAPSVAPAALQGSSWMMPLPATTPMPPASGNINSSEEDDEWGDFEEVIPAASEPFPAAPLPAAPAFATPLPAASFSWANAAPPPPQPKTRLRAPTIDLVSNTLIDLAGIGMQARNTAPALEPVPAPAPVPKAVVFPDTRSRASTKKPADPNVLFDAEDFDGTESFGDGGGDDDDDEFGDFETGQPSRTEAAPPPVASMDLLSLDEDAPVPAPAVASASRKEAPPPLLPSQRLGLHSFGSTVPAGSAGSLASWSSPSYPQAPRSPSFQHRNPFPGLAVATPKSPEFPEDDVSKRSPSPVTAWPGLEPEPKPLKQKPKPRPEKTKSEMLRSGKPTKKGTAAAPVVDDWDAWDTEEAPTHNSQSKRKAAPTAASEWDWEGDAGVNTEAATKEASSSLPAAIAKVVAAGPGSTSAAAVPDNTPPPTNVPPPSIVLSMFPSLFAQVDTALLKATAKLQPAAARAAVLSHPKTVAFLRNYLQLAAVAGRVLAGRKQRWHRDKFLAQGMAISAAGSSRGGGMKLAGIDRAQGQREDREAADVVAAWQQQLGRLRSAVATANGGATAAATAALQPLRQPLKLPRLPELGEHTAVVTVAKAVPTAPRPCVVCGLRRDERVRGIDGIDGIDGGEVQDIFGEWWVDHWGHRACRNFWIEHEASLRSR